MKCVRVSKNGVTTDLEILSKMVGLEETPMQQV